MWATWVMRRRGSMLWWVFFSGLGARARRRGMAIRSVNGQDLRPWRSAAEEATRHAGNQRRLDRLFQKIGLCRCCDPRAVRISRVKIICGSEARNVLPGCDRKWTRFYKPCLMLRRRRARHLLKRLPAFSPSPSSNGDDER